MYKLGAKIVASLIVAIALIGLGAYLYHRYSAESKPQEPEITREELQLRIRERLRLITTEVSLQKDVNLRQGNYSAEGTADIIAYLKYDLEQIDLEHNSSSDTIRLYLPEPDVELGRRPDGNHSIRYYEYNRGLFGMSRSETSNREAVRLLDETILEQAHDDLLDDDALMNQSRHEAQQKLQRFVNALYPGVPIVVMGETLPRQSTVRPTKEVRAKSIH